MKVRIVHDYRGNYPQVKKGFRWLRVVESLDSSFYYSSTLEHPRVTPEECREILSKYINWLNKDKSFKVIKEWETVQQ